MGATLSTLTIAVAVYCNKRIRAEEYWVASDSGANYVCQEGPGSTCIIYCNEADEINGYQFGCGNAETCFFYCEEKKCAELAIINATSSSQLYIISTGQECMKDSIIYCPDYGSANLEMPEQKKGFNGMDVFAGSHTQNIIISCESSTSDKDDCNGLNVDATTAQYLEIRVSNQLEYEAATIDCPVNSDYNGPEIAPCIIDASGGGKIGGLTINAPEGIPKQVWVELGTDGSYTSTVTIECNTFPYGDGSSASPFNEYSSCWWTNDPTTDPTIDPTHVPTAHPTKHPTPAPTQNPTPAPTNPPTPAPTLNPTQSPTFPTNMPSLSPTNPSQQPSLSPTPAPTLNPTPAPTFNPTNDPTHDPTKDPTADPTLDPTVDPSHDPTSDPTCDPTSEPSPNPTPSPILMIPLSPTISPGIETTEIDDGDGDKDDLQNSNGEKNENKSATGDMVTMVGIIVGLLIGTLLLACLSFGFFRYKKRKNSASNDVIIIKMSSNKSESVVSTSNMFDPVATESPISPISAMAVPVHDKLCIEMADVNKSDKLGSFSINGVLTVEGPNNENIIGEFEVQNNIIKNTGKTSNPIQIKNGLDENEENMIFSDMINEDEVIMGDDEITARGIEYIADDSDDEDILLLGITADGINENVKDIEQQFEMNELPINDTFSKMINSNNNNDNIVNIVMTNMITDEGGKDDDVVNNINNYDKNDVSPQKQNKVKENKNIDGFRFMISDDIMAQNMVMDDIIDDMENNEGDNSNDDDDDDVIGGFGHTIQ